jgi:hypothetical protein
MDGVMLAGAQLERDAAAAFVSAQDVDAPGTERAGSCKVSHLGERLCWFVYLSVCVYYDCAVVCAYWVVCGCLCVCLFVCVCVCVCVCAAFGIFTRAHTHSLSLSLSLRIRFGCWRSVTL